MGQEIQRRADGGISVAAVAGDPFKAVGVMGIFYEKAFPVAKTALKRARFEGFTEAGTEKKGFLRATGGQNCEFSGARLSAGMGFSEYLTEGGINPHIDDPDDPPRAFAVLPYSDGDGKRIMSLL